MLVVMVVMWILVAVVVNDVDVGGCAQCAGIDDVDCGG